MGLGNSYIMIPYNKADDELNEILNIKFEELTDLDWLEDTVDNATANALTSVETSEKAEDDLSQPVELGQLFDLKVARDLEKKLEKKLDDKPRGSPYLSFMTQVAPGSRSEEYKTQVQVNYQEAIKQVAKIYTTILAGKSFHYSNVLSFIESFCKILIKDRAILLNLTLTPQESEDYLYDHALRVSILSLVIATANGYNREQVLEVGVAGLLADVGMMKIPKSIRMKNGRINQDEFYEIQKHPIFGIYLLEKIQSMPDPVAIAAYQHHERMSGVGYPKRRKHRIIHNYARIVAIADVYQALSSPRNYRGAMLPFHAMTQILKMARLGLLDSEIVRKFLHQSSIFPIGSYVELSDGRSAKVVQASAGSVEKPIVSVLKNKQGKVIHKNRIFQVDLSQEPNMRVSGPLNLKSEAFCLMDGF